MFRGLFLPALLAMATVSVSGYVTRRGALREAMYGAHERGHGFGGVDPYGNIAGALRVGSFADGLGSVSVGGSTDIYGYRRPSAHFDVTREWNAFNGRAGVGLGVSSDFKRDHGVRFGVHYRG